MSYQLFAEEAKQKQIDWLIKIGMPFVDECQQWRSELDEQKPDQFYWLNGWFGPMDAEVYHYIIRYYKPRTIIEIGRGNCTKISKAALILNKKPFELITVDPFTWSGAKINHLPTKHYNTRLENAEVIEIKQLQSNDIFFMDSTHTIMSPDVQKEYEVIWNELPKGCIIHWHDIHLPQDYQYGYGTDRHYTDQYALLGLLESHQFEILIANNWIWNTCRDNILFLLPGMQYLLKTTQGNPLCGSFWVRKL